MSVPTFCLQAALQIRASAQQDAQRDLGSAKDQAAAILAAAQEVGRHAQETEEQSAAAMQQVGLHVSAHGSAVIPVSGKARFVNQTPLVSDSHSSASM